MKTSLPRRAFLHNTSRLLLGAAAGVIIAPGLLAQTAPAPAAPAAEAPKKAAPPKLPALPTDKVQAIIGQAHRSLDGVRALVEEMPLLVNACWDHGGGDFETPLQAAAHTGRRNIAEYLLSRQARIDVFAAAMMGQLDYVKATFALDPRAHEIPGPHGWTLLHCAIQGGDEAQPVVDWMLAYGVPDVRRRPLPVWPAPTT